MEEYLQHMKTLRSHINDVEDQATKMSVEEQMQITTIQTLQNDLDLAKSEARRLKEETEQMVKAKGHICFQILEKKKKVAALESDSITLSQTLELIQQERVSLSAKLVEKSTYYTKVVEDIDSKLREQQELINTYKSSSKPQLDEMNIKSLEEELQALLSDKAGETEYLQSLHHQIETLKGISHMVRCACGVEYKVQVDLCA